MTATVVAVGLVLLAALNIGLLGSYHYDVSRLEERVDQAEADVVTLTNKLASFAQWHADALWARAQAEISHVFESEDRADHE